MTTTIIFSKDRAFQADGCLRSFFHHNSDQDAVRVVWRATSDRHAAAYRDLMSLYQTVRFIREGNFEQDVRALLLGADEHVLFVVDDTIFVRKFSLAQAERLLSERPQAIGFSLRLGRNTTHCYPTDKPQAVPNHAVLEGNVMAFRWHGQEGDFGYPFEVSSSVYRTADALQRLDGKSFRNPNELEVALMCTAPDQRYELLCHTASGAFALAINRVQHQFRNRHGGQAENTADALLERWEAGFRMNVTVYHGITPSGCHMEMPVSFERRHVTSGAIIGFSADGVPDVYTTGEALVLDLLKDIEHPIVFDVGAHVGEYARLVFERLPNANVSCFEPNPETHVRLYTNVVGLPRVTVYPFGMSDEYGEAPLWMDEPGSGMSSRYRRRVPGRPFEHQVVGRFERLDHLGAIIDLLKIDTEGHEFKVLLGARETLKAGRIRMIQFEGGGTWIDSRTFLRDFYELLGERWLIHRIEPTGLVPMPQWHEGLERFSFTNYLAVLR